ncbi:unnamed protein product [Arctia plantaginis]|uniref:Uncharacterized protein n=1 Tax=Arctia plantaginis TaxID=874455 RepID=A0A8S0Z231_ARCPL|nr:unnamed protein product [Arctia plantaginis]
MRPCRANVSLLEEDIWREQQCSAHDDTPYGGELFHWRAHRDDAEPCALTCRGTPQHSGQSPEPTVSLDDEDRVVVTVLAARVSDGTRCRPGSLDMCIDGRCQNSRVVRRQLGRVYDAMKQVIDGLDYLPAARLN